jgi:hypothetical protein
LIRLLGLFIVSALAGPNPTDACADLVQPPGTDESRQPEAGQSQPSGVNTTVVVTAAGMEIPLTENPASTTVASQEILRMMPKAIAAEEALRLVPGVKVDNRPTGMAFYFLDRVELGPRWGLMVDLRCDRILTEIRSSLPPRVKFSSAHASGWTASE